MDRGGWLGGVLLQNFGLGKTLQGSAGLDNMTAYKQ